MPSRLAIAQKAAIGSLDHSLGFIWISDFQLQESFNHFTHRILVHQCIRHGSNVPGPLEARNRLSGRRLNISAVRRSAAPPLPPLDLASLWSDWAEFEGFGKWRKRAREAWSWQPPAKQVRPYSGNDEASLPTWLEGQGRVVDQPGWSEAMGVESQAVRATTAEVASPTLSNHEGRKNSAGMFMFEIGEAQNIEDIRAAFHRLDLGAVSLDVEPLSTAAFNHLLSLDGPFAECLEFLNDPNLNQAQAMNFRAFVDTYKAESVSLDQYSDVVEVYTNMIAAGRLEGPAAEAFVQYLPFLRVDAQNTVDADVHFEAYLTIWTALKSRLQGEGEQKASIYARLLGQIVGLPEDLKHSVLAADILQSCTGLHHMDFNMTFKRTLRRYTCMLLQQHVHSEQDTSVVMRPTTSSAGAFITVDGLLNSLPSAFARSWIQTVSRAFAGKEIHDKFGRKPWEQMLEVWLRALRNCSHLDQSANDSTWAAVYEALAKTMRPKKLISHFDALQNFYMTPFILWKYWLCRNIHIGTPRGSLTKPTDNLFFSPKRQYTKRPYKESHVVLRKFRAESSSPSLVKQVEDDFHTRFHDRIARGHVSRRAAMFVLIESLSAFPREQRECVDFTVKLLLRQKSSQTFEEFQSIAKLLKKRHVHPSIVSRYVQYSSKKLPQAAAWLIDVDRRQWLSANPELPIRLIRAGANPSFVFRLLKRWDPTSSRAYRHRPHYAKNRAMAKARVRLVHNIALEMAQANHLTRRQAFAGVLRCYILLRRARAPLYREMSRAMVHVVVIRRMQSGERVSSVVFRLILNLVRWLEGPEVAHELDVLVWKHRIAFSSES